ncbi:alpha/beta hydrolase [Microbacterium sp. cx-55]|uniref:alpha/beta hydrolase n=1 Tax=unclassified Microbacterium TaxID=2609290 RepID=UPI001CBA7FA2|nr:MULTISPECIES: alpha/beta hydrolase [unclassified Microbacterium]MBZ4486745.1 alpha/beta hydrolase [Microbacterium sp. cx-55]MCC4907722.1 alpha/beta hydrolase [Microbacterium sp. cx-59]UGB36298.1 alpha/beta hydrolase [Microbacterium sp. cx-55]
MLTAPVPPFRSRRFRWTPFLVGLFALLVAWAESFFLRAPAYGVLVIMILLCAALIRPALSGSRTAVIVPGAAALGVAAQLGWMIWGWYPAVVVAQVAAIAVGFACIAGHHRLSPADGRPHGGARSIGGQRLRRLLRSTVTTALMATAVVVSLTLVAIAVVPAGVAVALQSALGQTSSYAPRGPENATSVTANGDRLTSDIAYGSKYPNSFLDVYIADDDASIARPTYIYIHGGGWIAGTKATGDPNAPDAGFSVISNPVLDGGYNFVSLDYGLAPTVSYPGPVEQISQAVVFLQQNAKQLGLDMDNVVISGGSAGGQLAGQFANIQTNPAYAERVGIDPVIGSALKAVVLDSAALELHKTGETQAPVPLLDFFFGLSARTYLGTSDAVIAEASVTNHVTADFPPTFIADGNVGTFPDQASALHERLDDLGVPNAVFLPTAEEASLGHGFMGAPSVWTDSYNAQKLAFLASLGL